MIEISPKRRFSGILAAQTGRSCRDRESIVFSYIQDKTEFDVGNTRIRYIEISK